MLAFIILVVLIPFTDQLIKHNLRENFAENLQTDTFIPFLKIVKTKNFGAAFGILSGQKAVLWVFTAIIILCVLYLVFTKKVNDNRVLVYMAFIVGGGLGNLIDRLFFGYVTDYLKIDFFPPVCNLSDYFICVGSVMLIAKQFFRKKNKL